MYAVECVTSKGGRTSGVQRGGRDNDEKGLSVTGEEKGAGIARAVFSSKPRGFPVGRPVENNGGGNGATRRPLLPLRTGREEERGPPLAGSYRGERAHRPIARRLSGM